MSIWSFRRSRVDEDAERLLQAVTAASRRPEFFGPGRIADTLEGRLELMTLHAGLALLRLRAEPGAAALTQQFVDKLFRSFDAGLREAAIGDTAVPKRMAKVAAGFYGRVQAYEAALADVPALEAAMLRNVLREDAAAYAKPLAEYAAKLAAWQAKSPLQALFAAEGWQVA
jgi:cytochrome b pre-mRNA-processing protein 3